MQQLGVDALIYLDGIDKGKREERTVLAALAASGHYDPVALFPEYFPEDVVQDDGSEHGEDVDYDYSGVKWELPSHLDEDEMEQLRQVMGDNLSVGVSEDTPLLPEVEPDTDLDFAADREWT